MKKTLKDEETILSIDFFSVTMKTETQFKVSTFDKRHLQSSLHHVIKGPLSAVHGLINLMLDKDTGLNIIHVAIISSQTCAKKTIAFVATTS